MYILKEKQHTNKKTKEGVSMEEARKKLRLCLAVVVAAAVIIGLIYYFGDVKKSRNMSEGTLVRQTECEFKTASAADRGGLYGFGQ